MTKTHKLQNRLEYPNIIRSKRLPYHHSFEALERQRQNKSMKQRVAHVKNIQQRRKDRNDVVVYPSYFVRDRSRANDVRIDGYVKKALDNSQWEEKQKQFNKIYKIQKEVEKDFPVRQKYSRQLKKYQYNLRPLSNKGNQHIENNPEQESELPTPIFYNRQPIPVRSAQQLPTKSNNSNLPENDIRSILDFIYQHLLHREGDLQALKSRMCHAYGRQQVQNTWKLSMRLLQRDI